MNIDELSFGASGKLLKVTFFVILLAQIVIVSIVS